MSVSVNNTDAQLASKTLAVLEADETKTGLTTFDRDPSAPFAVASGSAVVTNLDADKVDGHDLDQDVKTTSTPTFAFLKLTGVAFASLPASPVAGELAYVTDSNTAVWGATVAGGGANKVLVWYNGTNWTVAGK